MSRENVEVVRRLFDATARGDTATVYALYDPDVEIDNTRGHASAFVAGTGTVRGHDGLREFWRDWDDAWEQTEATLERLLDAGNHVVSVTRYRGRGKASGAEVGFTVGNVWTIREGKIVKVAFFASATEALEAVGLSE